MKPIKTSSPKNDKIASRLDKQKRLERRASRLQMELNKTQNEWEAVRKELSQLGWVTEYSFGDILA